MSLCAGASSEESSLRHALPMVRNLFSLLTTVCRSGSKIIYHPFLFCFRLSCLVSAGIFLICFAFVAYLFGVSDLYPACGYLLYLVIFFCAFSFCRLRLRVHVSFTIARVAGAHFQCSGPPSFLHACVLWGRGVRIFLVRRPGFPTLIDDIDINFRTEDFMRGARNKLYKLA